jgi:hypothetical protein
MPLKSQKYAHTVFTESNEALIIGGWNNNSEVLNECEIIFIENKKIKKLINLQVARYFAGLI